MNRFLLSLSVLLFSLIIAGAKAPQILFVCGEKQYGTEESLRALASGPLLAAGYESVFVTAGPADLKNPKRNEFKGLLEALKSSDVLVVATWRRFPTEAETKALQQWVADGKPVLGIRTGSHAFSARAKWTVPDGHLAWESFDRDVFGASYSNHAPLVKEAASQSVIRRDEDWNRSQIGETLPLTEPTKVGTVLYRMKDLDPGAKVLVWGQALHQEEVEQPVIWGLQREGHRSVFSSLGAKSDFEELPWLSQLMVDAIGWLAENPAQPNDDPSNK